MIFSFTLSVLHTQNIHVLYLNYSSMFLGLSGGAIAGIIVAGLVFIAIGIALIVVGVILYKRMKGILVITIIHVHCTHIVHVLVLNVEKIMCRGAILCTCRYLLLTDANAKYTSGHTFNVK